MKKTKIKDQILKLNKFNKIMGLLHFIQGLAVLLLSTNSARDITIEYFGANPDTGRLFSDSRVLFSVELAPLVALFFFMSAIAHIYVSGPGRKEYEADLKKGINKTRWYEYSASASLMLVLIGMLTGMFNIVTLILLFSVAAIMNLMGLVMELYNQKRKKISWLAYYIGCLAGVVPWLVIGLTLWAGETASSEPGQSVPGFVYAIFVSLFLLFNTFAINMVLQYKKVGKWKDYLYGEKVYIVLSLVAKSVLAWQIFAGALQPL